MPTGHWLAMQLIERLGLDDFLAKHLPAGREHVRWSLTAMILVIARLLDPSSELHIAERWYGKSALPDLLFPRSAQRLQASLYWTGGFTMWHAFRLRSLCRQHGSSNRMEENQAGSGLACFG